MIPYNKIRLNYFLVFAIALGFTSCQIKERSPSSEVNENLSDSDISEDMKFAFKKAFDVECEFMIIFLMQESDCSPCSMHKIAYWKNYSKILSENKTKIVLILPGEEKFSMASSMKELGINYSYLYDARNDFFDYEGQIKNGWLETFVVNRDLSIVLKGNPINNAASFQHFKAIISTID